MRDVTWSFEDQNTRFRHETWRQVFDNQLESTPLTIQRADPLFSLPLGEGSADTLRWMTREAIWDSYHTISFVAVLQGEELAVSHCDRSACAERGTDAARKNVKKQIFEAMNGDDVEQNEKGEVALHGHTVWYWTTAVPGAPLKNGG